MGWILSLSVILGIAQTTQKEVLHRSVKCPRKGEAMIWSMEMSGVSYSLLRWAGSEEWASGQEPWEGLAYSEVFVLVLLFLFGPPPPPPINFLHNCYRPLGKSQLVFLNVPT